MSFRWAGMQAMLPVSSLYAKQSQPVYSSSHAVSIFPFSSQQEAEKKCIYPQIWNFFFQL